MEREILNIRRLLLLIVIPIVLYILNILSFIFIPLAFGLFGTFLFFPLMRWFENKKLPKLLGVFTVVLIVSIGIYATYEIVHLAAKEISSADTQFKEDFNKKYDAITDKVIGVLDIEIDEVNENLYSFFKNDKVLATIYSNITSGLNIARDIVTTLVMSLFFMLLLLMGSMNIEKTMEILIFKDEERSSTAFKQVEKDIFMFVLVKFILSLGTGIFFTIACYAFGVSFPIFWGVMAFLLNFIQFIGSIVAVIALAVFALVELGFTGTLLFFTIILIAIEAIIGGVLEPILMGRSFSINTITVLVMLAIWGLIWGIPGMILSVPITVLIKTILDRFPNTAVYAKLLS